MRRISAVLFGFAGAMVILQPGFRAIEWGAIAQLAAAPLFAATLLIGKRLTETESNGTIVAALASSSPSPCSPPHSTCGERQVTRKCSGCSGSPA